jgi:hypothetical protein
MGGSHVTVAKFQADGVTVHTTTKCAAANITLLSFSISGAGAQLRGAGQADGGQPRDCCQVPGCWCNCAYVYKMRYR